MKYYFVVLCLVVAATSVAADQPASNAKRPTVYTDWPFDAEEALRRQSETSDAIKSPIVLETPLGEKGGPVLKWHLIPAGKFMMGSPRDEPGHEGDERLHAETISEPFYMLETQLTVEQHRALVGDAPATGAEDDEPQLPAGIAYRDTVDNVLPALAKQAPHGWKVILPDRVRLEYAARAGVATMNPGGDEPADAAAYAWTRENSGGKVHPVGQKRPNAWGLHDVIGNRWHWFWRIRGRLGDSSQDRHIVYGGAYQAKSGGNGARLANIMISTRPEGARFALIRKDTPLPEGHPDTARPAN